MYFGQASPQLNPVADVDYYQKMNAQAIPTKRPTSHAGDAKMARPVHNPLQ